MAQQTPPGKNASRGAPPPGEEAGVELKDRAQATVREEVKPIAYIIDQIASLNADAQKDSEELRDKITEADREARRFTLELTSEVHRKLSQASDFLTKGIAGVKERLNVGTDRFRIVVTAGWILLVVTVALGAVVLSAFGARVPELAWVIYLTIGVVTIVAWAVLGARSLFKSRAANESALRNIDLVNRDLEEAKLAQVGRVPDPVSQVTHPILGAGLKALGTAAQFVRQIVPVANAVMTTAEVEAARDRFRADLLFSLTKYRFTITPEVSSKISGFTSLSSDPEAWAGEISSPLAALLNVPSAVVMLVIADSLGPRSTLNSCWQRLRASPDGISQLSDRLVMNGLVRGQFYPSTRDTTAMTAAVLKSMTGSYSLDTLGLNMQDFDRRLMILSFQLQGLGDLLGAGAAFASCLRDSVHDVGADLEVATVAAIATNIGYPARAVACVYRAQFQSFGVGKPIEEVTADASIEALTELLCKSPLIRAARPEEVVRAALIATSRFYPSRFVADCAIVSDALDFSTAFGRFLDANGLPNASKSQAEVAKIAIEAPQNSWERLRALAFAATVERMWQDIGLSGSDEFQAGLKATLCLFLSRQWPRLDDVAAGCWAAVQNDLACEILYDYVYGQDETNGSADSITMSAAVRRVKESRERTFVNELRQMLQHQIVPRSRSELTGKRQAAISELMQHHQDSSDGRDRISVRDIVLSMEVSIREFLELSVDPSAIPSYLRDHLLDAYIVTSPGDKPLMKTFESDAWKLAQDQMANEDPHYHALIRMDRGSGKATRVGVIPLGMTFHKFTDLFHNLLRLTETLSAEMGGQEETTTAAYIIRVSPSPDAMSLNLPPGSDVAKPDQVIRDLMVRQIDADQATAILVAADPNAPGVALRSVIRAAMASKTTTALDLVWGRIQGLLPRLPALASAPVKKRIQTALQKELDAGNTLDLARRVAKDMERMKARKLVIAALTVALPAGPETDASALAEVGEAIVQVLAFAGTFLTT